MTRTVPISPPSALEALRARLDAARLVLCDIDGCLIEDDRPCPGAIEFVARQGDRLRLVTNNSTATAVELSARLAAIGLDVAPDRCFLAGELTVAHVAEHHARARVLVVGSVAIRARAEALGLRLVDDRPDVVLLCNDPAFDADRLQRLVTAAHRGVPIVVANPDRWRPDRAGRPLIETGTLLAALRAAVPRAAVTIIGKPEPEIFRRALSGLDPRDAVMIGDNRETDLLGAESLGLTAIHIGRAQQAVAPALANLLGPSWS